MNIIAGFFSHFIQPDLKTALLVVLNLVVIESLLSVDNAAVLASLVLNLPQRQRKRALRIGIVFAYLFRGCALLGVMVLIKINWLKLLGGAYLIYLCVDFFAQKILHPAIAETQGSTVSSTKRRKLPGLNHFWSTVIMVEAMDITFSIDNVFAAVAFTNNMYLICLGVFIGIITMRMVAGYFVKLMEKFPFLDKVAFILIGVLGLRLCSDFFCAYLQQCAVCVALNHEKTDYYFSILTVAIFFLPILASIIFNFPRKRFDNF